MALLQINIASDTKAGLIQQLRAAEAELGANAYRDQAGPVIDAAALTKELLAAEKASAPAAKARQVTTTRQRPEDQKPAELEAKQAPEPEPEAASAPTVTLDQIKKLAADLSLNGKAEGVKAVLKKHEAKKLSELDGGIYSTVFEELGAL